MKNIKLVLIGYGNMGRDWGEIIKKNKKIKLIGVVDILEKNRTQAIKDFLLESFHVADNLEKLLSRFKADAIIDASPPFAHSQNAKMALNYGCHVLGEKPISLTLEDAEKLVQLSKSNKKIYMVNQNYRRNPLVQIIKDRVGNLGKLYSINIDYYQSLEFKDTFRYSMDHPLLLEMAIHHFDLIRAITGQNASSVYASEFNHATSKFMGGSSAIVIFQMNGSTLFSYRGSWSSVGFDTSFNGNWRVIGEHGSLIWDGNLDLSLEKRMRNGHTHKENIEVPDKFRFAPYELFLYELEQNLDLFLDSISSGNLPDCWCGDNINSLAMVLSAIESAKSGRKIKITRNYQKYYED